MIDVARPFGASLWFRRGDKWARGYGHLDRGNLSWWENNDASAAGSGALGCWDLEQFELENGHDVSQLVRDRKSKRFPKCIKLVPRHRAGLFATSAAPDAEVIALLSSRHPALLHDVVRVREKLQYEGRQGSDCDMDNVLQAVKELHACILGTVIESDDVRSEHICVHLRARLWLSRLDAFASELMSDINRLRPQRGAAHDGAVHLIAAQMVTEACAKLDGIATLCEATYGHVHSMSTGDLLLRLDNSPKLSAVRDAGDPFVEQVATMACVSKRLVPHSRIPYMRFFANRACL